MNVSRNARLSVYNDVLVPTLMYGSEWWVWIKKHERRITAVEMRYLRGVFGYTRRDCVRNTLVYDECEIEKNAVRRVGVSQLRWFGHVERMSNDRLVKQVYVGEIEGERLRGRPRNKWIGMIDGLLRDRMIPSVRNRRACMNRTMNVDEAKVVCQDRIVWRRLLAG